MTSTTPISFVRKALRTLVLIIAMIAITAPAIASARLPGFSNPLGNGNDDLIKFIEKIVDLCIQIGAVIVVLYFVYAGFMFVTANGDTKKISTAKDAALYCVIGGLILLGAKLIISVMVTTVNQLK